MSIRPRAARAALALDRATHARLHAFNLERVRTPAMALFSIYRRANEGNVRAMIDGAGAGSIVALHALDEVAPSLRECTVGVGPGLRMELIDALWRGRRPPDDHYVVVADDDVVFPGAGIGMLVDVAHRAGLDLAMPAHAPGSHHTFRVTRQRAAATVRLTKFVEVGPVMVASPRILRRIRPFPPSPGMGWGLDVRWSSLSGEGFRLGVVDAVPVIHLGEVGAAYSRPAEEARLLDACRDVGVSSAYELAHEVGPPWRPWHRRPPWPLGEEGP